MLTPGPAVTMPLTHELCVPWNTGDGVFVEPKATISSAFLLFRRSDVVTWLIGFFSFRFSELQKHNNLKCIRVSRETQALFPQSTHSPRHLPSCAVGFSVSSQRLSMGSRWEGWVRAESASGSGSKQVTTEPLPLVRSLGTRWGETALLCSGVEEP